MKIDHSALDASGLLLARAEELLAARRLQAAFHAFGCAQEHGADPRRCAAGRWMVHALHGDFPAAWEESAAIRSRSLDDGTCFWKGEELAGKRVIVRCLHGFGDAVQFFRYAPHLNALAARVVWEVPPALQELARCFRGANNVISWESRHPFARSWDVQVEATELPCIFETRIDDLPVATKYLRLPGRTITSVSRRMGIRSSPRVGIVWATGGWNPLRSIPLHCLRRLLNVSGCELWNLQGGTARQTWRAIPNCPTLRDASVCGEGLLPFAAVVAQLDLVITVDTLAAHLAGALGVPAWLMLQYAADWRWMTERNDSPWYPSLRLFRQPFPDDWTSVVRNIEAELHGWLGLQPQGLAA